MKLVETFSRPDRPGLSFELFPPKTDEGVDVLMEAVRELASFHPDFFTCTYGAGGSTQLRTLEVAARVHREFAFPVASHLTCVGSTVAMLETYLQQAIESGIEYIVALRGDPPKGSTTFQAVEGGLHHANELVALIRNRFPQLGIAVAGYPEMHQEAVSPEMDLQYLKQKVDSGADIVVTQLFYDNQDFFRFRDACTRLGIRVPIVPGILPVTNLAQIQRITSMCKAKMPEAFAARLAEQDSTDWQFQIGVEFAIEQVRELQAQGVPGVHYYVLNRSHATAAVLQGLGS